MLSEGQRERIRRAYSLDHKSIRHFAREEGRCCATVKKALVQTPPQPSHVSYPRPAPIIGPFCTRIEELLAQAEEI